MPGLPQVTSVPSPTRAVRRASQRAATVQASTDGEEEVGGLSAEPGSGRIDHEREDASGRVAVDGRDDLVAHRADARFEDVVSPRERAPWSR